MGWDGIGMDLRVGGGIEHLTVLITIGIENLFSLWRLTNIKTHVVRFSFFGTVAFSVSSNTVSVALSTTSRIGKGHK